MKKLFCLMSVLLSITAFSQPAYVSEVNYGPANFDRAYGLCQTSDGGFVLAGISSNEDGSTDALIVKFSKEFDFVWERRYGEGNAQNEAAYDIKETHDGYLIITGRTDSYSTHNSDIFVLKLTSGGASEWVKTFGDADHDEGSSLIEITEDNNGADEHYYVVAGKLRNPNTELGELFLMKLNQDGSVITDLAANYNGTGILPIEIESYGSGYALCGGSKISVLNADGKVSWENNFTVIGEGAYDFDVLDDGSFIMTGCGNGFPGNAEYYLMKIKVDGTMDWVQYYGGESVDIGFSVEQTSDGGYLMSGSLWSFGNYGNDEIGLIKTNSSGDVDWFYIHEDDGIEWGYDLMLLENGDFIISGSNSTLSTFDADFYLVRFTYPYADFQASPNPACTGETINLSPDYLVTGATYNWSLNGNTITTPSFTPAEPGTYTVTLDVNGLSKTQEVIVKDVIADFSAEPTLTWVGTDVSFTDKSYCNNNSVLWDFNEEGNSQEQNPVFAFGTEGLKDITLVAQYNGITDTKQVPGYIKVFCNAKGESTMAWISAFQFGSIANISGNNGGYENFSSTPFSIGQGSQYAVILTPGQAAGKPLRLDWRIWLDYNMDGVFQDNELAFSANNARGEVNGTITVPDDAMPGTSLMRVAVFENFDNTSGPCSTGFSGEIEDYSFEVNKASLPPVVDFEASTTLLYTNNTLTLEDLSYNNPTSWLWTITDEAGSSLSLTVNDAPTITHAFEDPGLYTVKLDAFNAIGSGTKTKVNYIEVVEDPGGGSNEYCAPESIYVGNLIQINYVDINNVVYGNNSSSSGYDYYSTDVFELVPGQTYAMSLDPDWDRFRFFWRVWIDLDNSFTFDEEELLYAGNNKKGTVNTTITIPETATYSSTRMRISMKREAAQTGPCEDGFEGEVEDYPVVVPSQQSGTLHVEELLASHIKIYPNPVNTGQLFIDLGSDAHDAMISVYNKYGSLMTRLQTSQRNNTLNVSGYAPGMYFTVIDTGSGRFVEKFVKQ